jgi:hypothetical protein
MLKILQLLENKNRNFYGKFIDYIIKDQDIFMIYFIRKKKFQENCMNIVYKKNGIFYKLKS